jgi:hypothetical protein
VNERHLKRLTNEYRSYFHQDRTHLGLDKETHANREIEHNPSPGATFVSLSRPSDFDHRAAFCLSTASTWLPVDRPAPGDKTPDGNQARLGTHAAQTP